MEKQYVNPYEGKIKEEEQILWIGKSTPFAHVFSVLLVALPMFAFIMYYSFEEIGDFGWIIVGLFCFAIITVSVVSLRKNSHLCEEYMITNQKIILHKRTENLRYFFNYDEVLDIVIKRNFVDRLLNLATLRLKVIHTRHRVSDLSIVGKFNGHIDMMHIKNYKLVLEAIKEIKRNLIK